MSGALVAARDAHARRDWPRAHALFRTAAERRPLAADDLAALGEAAWWLGRVDESIASNDAAYHAYLRDGGTRQAAVTALDIGYQHFLRGDEALGSGWMGRGQRLLADDTDCVEHAFLRYVLEVESILGTADPATVVAAARRLRGEAVRHGEASLLAVATMAEGRALIKQGAVTEGMARLDEAMVDVVSGELKPDWAGNIYCHVIAACHELVDIDRMWRWTNPLEQWCAEMPAAVLFTGICRVHRAQLLQVRGDWVRAEDEARQVCADLADIAVSTTAEAHYVIGELRRLGGDLAGAQQSYLLAHELGRDPQPGLALLRLAQGRHDDAMMSIGTALVAEAGGSQARAMLHAAQVEIALSAGVVETARKAADELADTAGHYDSPGLRVMAGQARGAVLLADAHPEAALPVLRDACARWRELDAPYACARVRQLLAEAYDALGDADAAARERAAAEQIHARLGAAIAKPPGGLTAREVEVLTLVAEGKTNREIAAAFVLSEKTVARHLSNIFTKLGVPSRTAAAAYAFDHGLVVRASG